MRLHSAFVVGVLAVSGCNRKTEIAAKPTAPAVAAKAEPAKAGRVEPAWYDQALLKLSPRVRALRESKVAGCPRGMVLIPKGKPTLGTTDNPIEKSWAIQEDQGLHLEDQLPAREVEMDSYCVDATAVSTIEYKACAAAGVCPPLTQSAYPVPCGFDDADTQESPVSCVDFASATAYCAARGGRIPTEDEWEYAARGTDGRVFPSGTPSLTSEGEIDVVGRECSDVGKLVGPCSVGILVKNVSPFGMYDAAGMKRELTSTPWFLRDRRHDPARIVAKGGGSYTQARLYTRAPHERTDKDHLTSFRCYAAVEK